MAKRVVGSALGSGAARQPDGVDRARSPVRRRARGAALSARTETTTAPVGISIVCPSFGDVRAHAAQRRTTCKPPGPWAMKLFSGEVTMESGGGARELAAAHAVAVLHGVRAAAVARDFAHASIANVLPSQ